MDANDDQLTAYLRIRFKTAGELTAYLNGRLWPLYKADRIAHEQAQAALAREQRIADKLVLEQARTAEVVKRRQAQAAEAARRNQIIEAARTAELARRSEIRKAAKQDALPNKRFCDLDGSPLSDKQVVSRSSGGHPVREIETGRIMAWRDEPQYGKGRGRWVEAAPAGG